MTIDYIPDTARYSDYCPGQNICLNCPLPLYHHGQNGRLVETCNQANQNSKHKYEPKCLIAQAKYYHVSLEEAEQIAEVVHLHPKCRITAWYYTEVLKERTATNGNTNNYIRTVTQDRPPSTDSGQRQNGRAKV
jgi:hypothetical protein